MVPVDGVVDQPSACRCRAAAVGLLHVYINQCLHSGTCLVVWHHRSSTFKAALVLVSHCGVICVQLCILQLNTLPKLVFAGVLLMCHSCIKPSCRQSILDVAGQVPPEVIEQLLEAAKSNSYQRVQQQVGV